MPSAVARRKGPYVPELLGICILNLNIFFILSALKVPLGLIVEMLNTESLISSLLFPKI